MKKLVLALVVIFSFISFSNFAQAGNRDGVLSIEESEYIKNRTVQVKTDCSPKQDNVYAFGRDPDSMLDGRGTGVILKSTKDVSYIITAHHVVENSAPDYFSCDFYIVPEYVYTLENKFKAEVIYFSSLQDVAILAVPTNFCVDTKIENDVYEGLPVWGVGYGTILIDRSTVYLSVTEGAVATMGVSVRLSGHFHRVTTQLYFGNSGGGIWTEDGKLVAITNFLIAVNGSKPVSPLEGAYYVKPITEVIKLVKDIPLLVSILRVV